MKRAVKILTGLICLTSLFFYQAPSTFAGRPFVTLTYNLEQMAGAADRIFVGRVTDAMEDYIHVAGGDLPVTVYTFEVEEVLKGSIGNTLTIEQVGHRSGPFGQSMPRYEVGSMVMLLLHADSQYGLTSPVGLGQGAFLVKMDGSTKVSVRNSRGNQGLLQGSARIDALLRAESPTAPHPLKTAKGALRYKEFRNLLLRLLQP